MQSTRLAPELSATSRTVSDCTMAHLRRAPALRAQLPSRRSLRTRQRLSLLSGRVSAITTRSPTSQRLLLVVRLVLARAASRTSRTAGACTRRCDGDHDRLVHLVADHDAFARSSLLPRIAASSSAPRLRAPARAWIVMIARDVAPRLARSAAGLSSWFVPRRRRKRNSALAQLALLRPRAPASLRSRSFSSSHGSLPPLRHELGRDRQLVRREPERLACATSSVTPSISKMHAARLDHGHPDFGRALALTHAGLGRLLA